MTKEQEERWVKDLFDALKRYGQGCIVSGSPTFESQIIIDGIRKELESAKREVVREILDKIDSAHLDSLQRDGDKRSWVDNRSFKLQGELNKIRKEYGI